MRRITLLLALFLSVSLFAIDTYYVRPTGDATSWSTQATADPTQVLTITDISELTPYLGTSLKVFYLAKGTYIAKLANETTLTSGYYLKLGNGEKIYGGFAGTETTIDLATRSLTDRDENGNIEAWEFQNETIIDGQDGTALGQKTKRLFGIENSAEVNGLSIKNFSFGSSVSGVAASAGGPIYVGSFLVTVNGTGTAPTGYNLTTIGNFVNCSVFNLSSYSPQGAMGGQGGAAIISNANSIVSNCLFEQCQSYTYNSSMGGALYVLGTGGKIKNSIFRNNKAYFTFATGTVSRGGAVYGESYSSSDMNLIIENCLFYNNSAFQARTTSYGYGGAFRNDAIAGKRGAQIINCTFSNNHNTVTTSGNVELINSGTLVNCILFGGSNGFRANSTANYYLKNSMSNVVNLDMAANAVYPTVTSNTALTANDFGFTRPTTFNGAVFPADANYATKIDEIRKANYSITKPGNVLANNSNWGLQTMDASYSSANTTPNPTVTLTATIPTKDITSNDRKSTAIILGAYNYTPLITTTSNVSTIGTLNDKTQLTVANGGHLTINQPTSVSSITVSAGGKLTLNDTQTLAVSNDFTLKSDNTNGTGTFVDFKTSTGGLTVTGATTVEQYLTAGRNWYVSSPLSGATSNVFSAASFNTNKLNYYNEPTGTANPWPQITDNTTSLVVGRGYISNMPANGVVTFTGGTLNTGAITTGTNGVVTLTRTTGQTKEGFNLVGNPYPSYLDIDGLQSNTDLESTYWIRSYNAGYVFDTYNIPGAMSTGLSGKTVSSKIPPLQAFWLRVKSGSSTATVAFTNSMRAHKDFAGNTFRAPKQASNAAQVLRLQVSNGTKVDEAVVYTNADASNGYDIFDSPKMSNGNVAIPEIYTTAGSEQLVINGLNSIPLDQEIPLGFKTGTANTFSIKATELRNFAADTKIVLKDKVDHTEQELTLDVPYSFNSGVVNDANRFSLIFKSAGVTTGSHSADYASGIQVYKNANNQIAINCSLAVVGNATVSVYNAVGQKLDSSLLNATKTVLPQHFTAGVYFVSVLVNGNVDTRKVVIN